MFPARYSCTNAMMTRLIFKPSRPHLPLSSRCSSSGNSTVMRAIGPAGTLEVVGSATHFSGSTGGFVAVASPVFFGMRHHLHGCTHQSDDLAGGGAVGFHFEHRLPKGRTFSKDHALRYHCGQHRKGVACEGGEHISTNGGIRDFAVNHKSSFEIFLEC